MMLVTLYNSDGIPCGRVPYTPEPECLQVPDEVEDLNHTPWHEIEDTYQTPVWHRSNPWKK